MSDDSNGITVTLKAGTGFEAPWIVIHASDVKDAISQIDTGDFATLAERTVSAAEFFRGAHNVKTGLSTRPAAAPAQDGPSWSQQGSQQAPALAAAPAGEGKSCVHGPMVLRQGTSAKGPWSGYFCPTPKGTAGQCSPEFLPRGR